MWWEQVARASGPRGPWKIVSLSAAVAEGLLREDPPSALGPRVAPPSSSTRLTAHGGLCCLKPSEPRPPRAGKGVAHCSPVQTSPFLG